jgi:Zn-dependent protease
MLHLLPLMPVEVAEWTARNLVNSVQLNLVLAVINMLPLPPLDGGRVAVGLLPDSLALPLAKLERFGLFILIGLLFLVPMAGDRLGMDLDIFAWLVHEAVNFLTRVIAAITRIG